MVIIVIFVINSSILREVERIRPTNPVVLRKQWQKRGLTGVIWIFDISNAYDIPV